MLPDFGDRGSITAGGNRKQEEDFGPFCAWESRCAPERGARLGRYTRDPLLSSIRDPFGLPVSSLIGGSNQGVRVNDRMRFFEGRVIIFDAVTIDFFGNVE